MKTTNLPFKMTSTRKPVTAASLLILMIKVFSGNTLKCNPAEYQIEDECCPMCLPGSRVKTDCTEFRSTSCLPCMDGSFMNKPTGLKQCFTCTSCDAGSGLKIKTSCTATSDTLCEPLEGFYCIDFTENHCVAAQKHSSCQPGQYIREKGTALRDTVCSDCSGGTFSDGTFPSCQPHTQCQSQNLQLIRAGTASTDAECGPHSSHGTVILISVGVVLFLFICIISFVAWKKKTRLRGNKGNGSSQTEKNSAGAETSEMIVERTASAAGDDLDIT
ncbi:tumor necrosis factor receptor superfamily member 14-like isoform X1 [Toxotes jaculatrix]|uniref:tumor necrosis factor receptor superfamily member 14-like isoform X1 n=1 Tax=Toxotes jaculatrix TaxID=941984 RepID=UPI001B3AEE0E|nr:tumor necrosis factor receptor superfamily member 14-like isoform X1 [Toxotes jaculatrix]XP_040919103.1 tumor necrosis factor receptor superfamily member 14-like isoform X1 [Toxotes jaculatrix]